MPLPMVAMFLSTCWGQTNLPSSVVDLHVPVPAHVQHVHTRSTGRSSSIDSRSSYLDLDLDLL